MKKYTFVKNLSLGFVSLNVKKGQTVQYQDNAFIYNNKKYNETRDFEIAIQHKWLIPSDKVTDKMLNNQTVEHNFGYEVKKQQKEGVSIPLSQFKNNILNEQQGFIQDGNKIKDINQSEIHVASVSDNKSKKQQVKQQENTKQVKKKQSVKKTAAKKQKSVSKIDKNMQISKQQQVGSVRGMKIVKGE